MSLLPLTIQTVVKGSADLEAFVNLIQKFGGALLKTIKGAEQFGQAMDRATVDISNADERTKGLIDTMALFTQQNKLAVAGVKITEEQYGDLAVAATKMAQATGQDATQAFNNLTESIAKGSTRALKEYGVDLDNTEDLVLAQKEAVEKLTAKYKEQEVQVETLSEAMFAFDNNIGTTIGLLIGSAGESLGLVPALNSVNDALAEMNSILARPVPRAFLDTFSAEMMDLRNLVEGTMTFWGGFLDVLSGEASVEDVIRRTMTNTSAGKKALEEARAEMYRQFIQGMPGIRDVPLDPTVLGGKGAKGKTSTMDFSVEDVEKLDAERRAESTAGVSEMFGQQAAIAAFESDEADAVVEFNQQMADFEIGRLERAAELAALSGSEVERGRLENEIRQKKLELIEEEISMKQGQIEQFGYDEDSPDGRKALLELSELEHERFLIQSEEKAEAIELESERIKLAKEKEAQSWETTNMLIDMNASAVKAAANAMASGTGSIRKSIGEALKSYGKSAMIENAVRALAETAKGIAKLASSYGTDQSAQGHFAAAATYGAASAMAAGIAGIGAGIAGGSKGRTYDAGTADRPAGEQFADEYDPEVAAAARAERDTVNVTTRVKVDKDDGLIEYVVNENDRRKRDGLRAIGD